jgi:hypothetical protein
MSLHDRAGAIRNYLEVNDQPKLPPSYASKKLTLKELRRKY